MPYSALLPWYQQNKRVLPFRGTHDPYAVWVSEIMLQQTRTETVAGYYTRFLARFPHVRALGEADEQEVLKLWEGLGYYSRARNLHRAARMILREYHGEFPRTYSALRALPGIGDYTAAAIASIAYRLPYPAIDGNLNRVLSRVHGIREDIDRPATKERILALAQEHIDTEAPGDWNQALMDLGATICTPGTPECDRCPLQPICDAYARGDAEQLPIRAAAKPPVPVDVGVGIVVCSGKVLLQQREASLLKGLWVFALSEGDSTPEGVQKRLSAMGVEAELVQKLGEARHVFTHRIWNMRLYYFHADQKRCGRGCQWADAAALSALPLPTAMRAARQEALRLLENNT